MGWERMRRTAIERGLCDFSPGERERGDKDLGGK